MKKSELIKQELEQVTKLYCLELNLKEKVIDAYKRSLQRIEKGEDEDREINEQVYNDFREQAYDNYYLSGYGIRKEQNNG